jgi:hypothetical protein
MFWHFFRFAKIAAHHPDGILTKTSVQITEQVRIFLVLSKLGDWGLSPIFGNFSKTCQNKGLRKFSFF